MNLFTALKAMDRRDASFIDSLSPEDRRDIDSSLGYTALRWMSATKDEDLHAYYIQAVNELANVNYFSLSAHKELQFKLLALTGVGSPTKHEWIAPPKGTKEGKLVHLIMTLIPDIEAEDALLWYEMNGKDGLDDLLKQHGKTDKERKELLK